MPVRTPIARDPVRALPQFDFRLYAFLSFAFRVRADSLKYAGQRTVASHMWMFYYSNRGVPCNSVGHYGCYGSTWIR